jgi:hypothetical protein
LGNIILKKITSSIFLTIVLIAGTFAAISPSSFITGVNADQCGEDVEACFKRLLTQSQFEQLSEALDSPTGVKVDILGNEVTLRSFEDICSALEPSTSSLTKFDRALLDILGDILNPPLNINSALLSCVYEAVNRLN